jgi:predicted enzyme related to lactoylglutathione lyase
MAHGIEVIVFPTSDLNAAKTFYTAYLGTQPYVDSSYYVGYKVGNIEIGLDPNSQLGPITYINVDDITATLTTMSSAGAEVMKAATDVGGGLLIAQIKDKDGNILGFRQEK